MLGASQGGGKNLKGGMCIADVEELFVDYRISSNAFHTQIYSPSYSVCTQSGLNVYCVRPRIVYAQCSKRCARAIVICKDNSLSGKVSFKKM